MTDADDRRVATHASRSGIDAGLFAIRIGVGLSFVLLFSLKQSEVTKTFVGQHGLPLVVSITAFVVVCGFLTRWAAALSALAWIWVCYAELRAGLEWFILPVRAAEFIIVFAALAVTGPGKYSLDHLMGSLGSRKSNLSTAKHVGP